MSNAPKERRWRLIANPRIQGELLLRLFAYWLMFQLAQAATFGLFLFIGAGEPTKGMSSLIPPAVVSFLCLPVVMLDLLKFSNRVVGPIQNIKLKVDALCNGEQVEDIVLRPNDHLTDLASSINQLKSMLEAKGGSVDDGKSNLPEVRDSVKATATPDREQASRVASEQSKSEPIILDLSVSGENAPLTGGEINV